MNTAFDLMADIEDVPSFDELVEQAPSLDPETVARQLLLRLAALEAHQTRVKAQARRIADVYQAKLDGYQGQIDQARQMLQNCVERQGERIAWPDLGTAYLTTRKPSVTVLDAEAFEVWARDHGFEKAVVDAPAAKKAVVQSVLTDGEAPPAWGEFVPESKVVVVKFAHNEAVPF